MESSAEFALEGRYDDETLAELGQYWMGELAGDERTPREKCQIQIILGRLAVETQYRAEGGRV